MKTYYTTGKNIAGTFFKVQEDAKKKLLLAGINTVNIQAALTRKNAQVNLKGNFTLRNSFTVNSIRFTQCPKSVKNFNLIISTAGATEKASYLERQEFGGTRKPENGTRLAIPTTAARGGNASGLIKRKYRLSQMQRVDSRGISNNGRTRKSNTVARAYIADKHKLLMSYDKAIYSVTNFQKSGEKISFEKTMIYQNKYKTTQTHAAPWLKPAQEQPAKDCQQIFNHQMDIVFTK